MLICSSREILVAGCADTCRKFARYIREFSLCAKAYFLTWIFQVYTFNTDANILIVESSPIVETISFVDHDWNICRSYEKVHLTISRSRHRRCSIIKGVLKNLAKFTGRHLCQSLFFNKVAGSCLFITVHLRPTAS